MQPRWPATSRRASAEAASRQSEGRLRFLAELAMVTHRCARADRGDDVRRPHAGRPAPGRSLRLCRIEDEASLSSAVITPSASEHHRPLAGGRLRRGVRSVHA